MFKYELRGKKRFFYCDPLACLPFHIIERFSFLVSLRGQEERLSKMAERMNESMKRSKSAEEEAGRE